MAVLSLTWKSPYVDKTVFILRRGPELRYKARNMEDVSKWRHNADNRNNAPNEEVLQYQQVSPSHFCFNWVMLSSSYRKPVSYL